jgi:hypothetical protein
MTHPLAFLGSGPVHLVPIESPERTLCDLGADDAAIVASDTWWLKPVAQIETCMACRAKCGCDWCSGTTKGYVVVSGNVGRCTNPKCQATGYVSNFERDNGCYLCGGTR